MAFYLPVIEVFLGPSAFPPFQHLFGLSLVAGFRLRLHRGLPAPSRSPSPAQRYRAVRFLSAIKDWDDNPKSHLFSEEAVRRGSTKVKKGSKSTWNALSFASKPLFGE